MAIHIDWDRVGVAAIPHDLRGPLFGFAVALGLAVAARAMRSGLLGAAAGGAGVVAGWYVIGGRLWVTYARPSVDHLAFAAAVALAIAILCEWLGRSRGALFAVLLTAVFIGWWLCGAPRNQPELVQAWPIGLGVGIAMVLYARSLATDALDPLRLALTGLTMAASFHVVMLPPVWTQLALVPALASLAQIALPAMPGLAALPIAADIATIGCLAVIDFGRLPHLRVGAVDVAAVAPLLALWLTPHVTSRVRFAGRAAAATGGVLAALVATGVVWTAMRVLGR